MARTTAPAVAGGNASRSRADSRASKSAAAAILEPCRDENRDGTVAEATRVARRDRPSGALASTPAVRARCHRIRVDALVSPPAFAGGAGVPRLGRAGALVPAGERARDGRTCRQRGRLGARAA